MERLGEGVGAELARFGVAGAITSVVAAWPAAVGDEIARNAWPSRLARDGTLVVNTSSSTWAFELAQLESTVREQLSAAMQGTSPARLRFVPGPLPEEPPPAEPSPGSRRLSPSAEAVAEAHRLAAAIEDDGLRERVARAAALSLERARDDRSFW